MRRRIALFLVLTFLFSALFAITASAGNHHRRNSEPLNICGNYYNEDGYRVYRPNVQYDEDGNAIFGNGCYYYNADGKRISAYGEAICYYDEDGNLCAGACDYCYDADGDRTACPLYNRQCSGNGSVYDNNNNNSGKGNGSGHCGNGRR